MQRRNAFDFLKKVRVVEERQREQALCINNEETRTMQYHGETMKSLPWIEGMRAHPKEG